MAEQRLSGKVASGGYAAGPLAILTSASIARRAAGDVEAETIALREAIAAAVRHLATLASLAEVDGAEILAFQIAMLEDDALAEPAFAAIAVGASADRAWTDALNAQIAGYQAAEDEYFRARASDLVDLRDRALDALSGASVEMAPPSGAIVLGDDITPSRFLSTDWSLGGGIALRRGSATSHVATLARARGVPMIVGVPVDFVAAGGASEALLDGDRATLWLDPAPSTREAFAARAQANERANVEMEALKLRPAVTADGTPIAVHANLGDLSELDRIEIAGFDGVGLVRTEFLFGKRSRLPDEDEQYRVYRRLAEWAQGKPVTIRTLDAGADKPIAGLTLDHENNPFLGVRGIRLSLARPEIFRVQLRALCRAAAHGAIEIMLPMVAIPAELEAARRFLAEEFAALKIAGVPCRAPALGVMVEVPAAAIAVDQFDADFFSIGSNDLTQYVMAAARDSDALADLNDPGASAVLRLIAHVASYAVATGRKASLCGDAGADPRYIGAFLRAGLRVLSVAPTALGRVKSAIAKINLLEGAP